MIFHNYGVAKISNPAFSYDLIAILLNSATPNLAYSYLNLRDGSLKLYIF